MNKRDYSRDRRTPYGRLTSGERRPSGGDSRSPRHPDDPGTGCESGYLNSLVETARELVVVLRQGDCITGQLAWYDHTCLKLTPSNGSPNLVIPKASIKYLYEATLL
jgi:hypothetical protein